MKSNGNCGFVRWTCACIVSVAATFSLCVAQADEMPADPVRTFNIAAQPLSKALLEFSKQSGLIVTVPSALVEGKTAPEIHGALPSSQALEKLLSGSGLKSSRTPTTLIAKSSYVRSSWSAARHYRLARLRTSIRGPQRPSSTC